MRFPLISLVVVTLATTACSASNPAAPGETPISGSAAPGESTGGAAMVSLAANPPQTFTWADQWTLTRSQCPVLWSNAITGSGTSRLKIRIDSLGNGVSQISVTESGGGTATDEEQRQFRFAYANTHQLRAGSSFTVNGTNTFNLVGPGGTALQLHVGSASVFRVNADNTVTLDAFEARGPQSCEAL